MWTARRLNTAAQNGQARVVVEFSDGQQTLQRTYIDDSPSLERLAAWARGFVGRLDTVADFVVAAKQSDDTIDLTEPAISDEEKKRIALSQFAGRARQLELLLPATHPDVVAAKADVLAAYTSDMVPAVAVAEKG